MALGGMTTLSLVGMFLIVQHVVEYGDVCVEMRIDERRK